LDGENQFFKTLRDGCFAVVKYKSATDVCKFCCDLPHFQNQDWQLGPLPLCLTWPSVTRHLQPIVQSHNSCDCVETLY
jgi:hypothetical protein